MSDRLATWASNWREDTIPYSGGCYVCATPCDTPGWLQFEAISTGICRHCIETIVRAAPDVAQEALATIPEATTKESTT